MTYWLKVVGYIFPRFKLSQTQLQGGLAGLPLWIKQLLNGKLQYYIYKTKYFSWHWWIFQWPILKSRDLKFCIWYNVDKYIYTRNWLNTFYTISIMLIYNYITYKNIIWTHILHNIYLSIYQNSPIIGNAALLVASISIGADGFFKGRYWYLEISSAAIEKNIDAVDILSMVIAIIIIKTNNNNNNWECSTLVFWWAVAYFIWRWYWYLEIWRAGRYNVDRKLHTVIQKD